MKTTNCVRGEETVWGVNTKSFEIKLQVTNSSYTIVKQMEIACESRKQGDISK